MSKSQEEKEELFKKARSLAPDFRALYKQRRVKLLEDRAKVLRDKQLALQLLQEKKFREKEKLTEEIIAYGLWQSEEEVLGALQKMKSNSEKLKALKCQLDFRKKVLEQTGPREIFFMTRNHRKLRVEEVVTNLVSLLSPTPGSSTPTPFVASQEGLIGKRIHHRWKDSSGTELWYYGTILSLVPGTTDWFNVKYDGEDTILSLNLFMDIEKGDLNILD